jgi:aminoglycoside phosphotransferase family enzyme
VLLPRDDRGVDARPAFVDALARSLRARLVETHISCVLLAAADAYKVKKPVRLGFVDYTGIDARRRFCEEEVRLNARLAPGLYLGVVRITGTTASPAIEGDGPVIDYAVHMRRFPDGALFSRKLQDGSLAPAHVDALADRLGTFHLSVSREPPSPACGSCETRLRAAVSALGGAASIADAAEAMRMRAWMEAESARLAERWAARRRAGFVRECHGDLHLDNIIALDGEVTAFDAI